MENNNKLALIDDRAKIDLIPLNERKDYSTKELQVVASSRSNRIKDLTLPDDAPAEFSGILIDTDDKFRRALVAFEVTRVARLAGSTEAIPDDIIEEAVEMIIESFGNYGLDELRLAYRLCAAGKVPKVEVSLFNKPFNLEFLSRILKAYNNYRKGLLSAVINAEHEAEKRLSFDPEKEESKRDNLHRTTLEKIVEVYASFLEDSGKEILLFPFHFSILEKIGMFEVSSEEEGEIRKEARNIVLAKLKAENEQKSGEEYRLKRISNAKAISEIKNGNDSGGLVRLFSIRLFFFRKFSEFNSMEATPEDVRSLLLDKYEEHAETLNSVRYVVTVELNNGSTKDSKPLLKEEVEELIEKLNTNKHVRRKTIKPI